MNAQGILFLPYAGPASNTFNIAKQQHEGNNIGINFAAGCLFRGRLTFMHEMSRPFKQSKGKRVSGKMNVRSSPNHNTGKVDYREIADANLCVTFKLVRN